LLNGARAFDAGVPAVLLADHVEDLEGLGLALDLRRRELDDLEMVSHRAEGVLADDDLTRVGDRAQARAGVHGIADHGVLERLAAAEVARDALASVDADADGDRLMSGGNALAVE